MNLEQEDKAKKNNLLTTVNYSWTFLSQKLAERGFLVIETKDLPIRQEEKVLYL